MGIAQPGRDERAPVAALRAEPRVAEDAGHQLRHAVRHRLDRKARLAGRERQAAPRQRRCHHGEGIVRIAAEACRIGQAWDDVQELEHRARPAVQEQERHGLRPGAGNVQTVQVDPVQRHLELREGIEPRLLRTPVEPLGPVADELAQIGEVGAIRPWLARRLVRKARPPQPLAQVGDRRIGDVQPVGLGARRAHRQNPIPCWARVRAITISCTSLAPSTSRACRA